MVKVEFKVDEIYARWSEIINKPVEEFDEHDRKAALFDYQETLKRSFRNSAPTKKQRLAQRRAERRRKRKEKHGD